MAERKPKEQPSHLTGSGAAVPASLPPAALPERSESPTTPPPPPAESSSSDTAAAAGLPASPNTPEPVRPRAVVTHFLPGKRVDLIDDGNGRGVGIRLSFDDPAERPSDEVKHILKDGDQQRPGFKFHRNLKQWRKRIEPGADPKAAVAIRLDAERRVEAVAEQMTHEDKLKADREHGGSGPGPGVTR